MSITCCTPDCPERSATCHATCQKYAEASAAHRAEQARIRLEKEREYKAYCARYGALHNMKNRRKKSY